MSAVPARTVLRRSLAAAAGVALVLAPSAAGADVGDRVRDIRRDGRVLDLVRRVTSISGDVRTSETPDAVEVQLAADVLFAFDSAALSPEAGARIQEVADRITQDATGVVAVVGHTDSVGEDAYNQALSQQRAQAVANALAASAPADYSVAGEGESEPVAPNEVDGADNPDGRQLNRRVTISFATTG